MRQKEQQRYRKKDSEGPDKHACEHQATPFRFFASLHGHRPFAGATCGSRRSIIIIIGNESGNLGREKAVSL
jgi:hypothetical protein